MSFLAVRDLNKRFPDGWTLDGVSFTVEEGEIACLLGPSGCGKTTLLRLIAGLEGVDSGQVLVQGEDVTNTPPHLRGFGLMFQEYALFPHRDVFGNVAFGLRMAGLAKTAIQEQVSRALELVGLKGFQGRDVNQLSGGERQRVALARSLAPQPCLLMLDEPLGALDRALRERLLEDLPAILKRVGVTTITVTHDQGEAFAIADRVILMDAGRVMQQGTPEEVYREPSSAWVARFLGLANLLDARVLGEGGLDTALGIIKVKITGPWEQGSPVTLLVRPEAVRLGPGPVNQITGRVTERVFRGSHYQLALRFEAGLELEFDWPYGQTPPAMGEELTLWLDPQGLTIVPED